MLHWLAVCLAFGGCGKGEKEEAPEVSVQAVPAARADISRVVNTEAMIFPVAQSAITPKINAPVKKFYVVRGQKVRQGPVAGDAGKSRSLRRRAR